MDVWQVAAPSVDYVTAALQNSSLLDIAAQPDNDVRGLFAYEHTVGWAGQSLPQPDAAPVQDNSSHRASTLVKGKATHSRTTRDRSRHDRRAKGYKQLWQQVTTVRSGQSLDKEHRGVALCDMSVEELVRLIQTIPADRPAIHNVSQALNYLDSRALAALLKELAKVGHANRAVEIFDWLRSLDVTSELSKLCDVYTYTTMISVCGQQQQLRRALELVAELRSRGIHCNVHTYSSLMNVCIKCGELELALDVYKQMRSEGSKPNVVTYNTLIDVYGKTGHWEKAVAVLDLMHDEGLEPEVRTYNTAIIACNMCGQPLEAFKLFDRLVEAGLTPISTTYTALISAYGKAGQLDKALETLNEMVRCGCERSVITYSALISACEKAGRWELALELFGRMLQEGLAPNTVTYNSLITACGQGLQCDKATEIFEQMRLQGCKPDVVTYTALIGAYERGGQWCRALKTFDQMQHQGCKPDCVIFQTMIEMLWQTGIGWAQAKAVNLFNTALRNWQFRFGAQQCTCDNGTIEVVLPAASAGVCTLTLHKWLGEFRVQCEKDSSRQAGPRDTVVLLLGRVRNNRDQATAATRESVVAILAGLAAPFMLLEDGSGPFSLQAPVAALQEWLQLPSTALALRQFLDQASGVRGGVAERRKVRMNEQLSNEMELELRCLDAFAAITHFEATHRLNFQAMGQQYLQARPQYIDTVFTLGEGLSLKLETMYDAVLLMDRVMSTGIQVLDSLASLFVAGVLLLAACQGELPENVPPADTLDRAISFPAGAVENMSHNVGMALAHDTAAVSTLRCLKLYYERLGADAKDGVASLLPRSVLSFTRAVLYAPSFLNFRPSTVAAAVLYQDRRARGWWPFWPSAVAHLTGLHDLSNPEFAAALHLVESLHSPQQVNSILNAVLR